MTTNGQAQSSNAADFHAQADDVFGRIATRYDLLCDLFSLGIYRLWKRQVATIITQEPWLQRAYLVYMKLCVPFISWVATGGDASAYRYLLKGIQEFPSAEYLAKEISSFGFEDVSLERLSLGIVAIHVARKPVLKHL